MIQEEIRAEREARAAEAEARRMDAIERQKDREFANEERNFQREQWAEERRAEGETADDEAFGRFMEAVEAKKRSVEEDVVANENESFSERFGTIVGTQSSLRGAADMVNRMWESAAPEDKEAARSAGDTPARLMRRLYTYYTGKDAPEFSNDSGNAYDSLATALEEEGIDPSSAIPGYLPPGQRAVRQRRAQELARTETDQILDAAGYGNRNAGRGRPASTPPRRTTRDSSPSTGDRIRGFLRPLALGR
jgi:hypothetical protein